MAATSGRGYRLYEIAQIAVVEEAAEKGFIPRTSLVPHGAPDFGSTFSVFDGDGKESCRIRYNGTTAEFVITRFTPSP